LLEEKANTTSAAPTPIHGSIALASRSRPNQPAFIEPITAPADA